jgi:hypothetical protein
MPYLKATKRKIILKNLYKDISGEDEWALCVFVCGGRTNTAITLLNGAEIISTNANGSLNEIFFILDINGFNNGPNMLGKDAFYLQIVPAIGGLTFMRKDDGESWDVIKTRDQLLNGPSGGLQKYQCNKKGRGTWCGELIRRDGWKISKDYPW